MTDRNKRDEYTKDRFDWLDQVGADPKLPASAFKVAYAIATKLWRTKGTVTLVTPENTASDKVREAWIGTRDIADKIAMSRFTVMTMAGRLEAQGHLEVDPGKQGRGHSNHYRLVQKGAPANLLDSVKGAHTSLLAGAQAEIKGAPTNLLNGQKVRRQTSRGAPTHLNPSVPFEDPTEERGAPQARPRRAPFDSKDSKKEPPGEKHPQGKTVHGSDSGVAFRAPLIGADDYPDVPF